MNILTDFQKTLLLHIGNSSLGRSFYLTGGTALSAFYLYHRYSEDLDFFSPDPAAVSRVPVELHDIARKENASLSFTRTYDTFLECFVENEAGEKVKMDFAQDSPFRLQPTEHNAKYAMAIDNQVDIACNKLSALFDRAEPKDFVDVYFISQDVMSFEQLVDKTRQKHLGIDDYWLAVALERVRQVTFLPRMIKPLELSDMQGFFEQEAIKLMDNIDPGLHSD